MPDSFELFRLFIHPSIEEYRAYPAGRHHGDPVSVHHAGHHGDLRPKYRSISNKKNKYRIDIVSNENVSLKGDCNPPVKFSI